MRGIWLGTPVRCAFGALALAVAGCTEVGPDFKTPDADVAKAWLAADQGAVRSDAAQDAAWWKVFADPVLDKLIDTAYQQNPSLHQAGVRVLQTQAQLGTAVGNLYPQQQQAFGSLTQEHVSKHYPNQSAEADRSYAVGQLGLTASWEIDFWGKFRRAIESADASLIASIDDYDSALVTLLSNVATTYVNIRTLQERLRIVQANIKIQEQSYQLALSRFRNGQTGERDVAQAKSELASTQAQLPQLQQALEQSRDALSVLLGLPPTETRGSGPRRWRQSPRLRPASRSASRRIFCAAVPTCAPPRSRRQPRVPSSARPRPSSIPPSPWRARSASSRATRMSAIR